MKKLLIISVLAAFSIGSYGCKQKQVTDADIRARVELVMANAPNVSVVVEEGVVTLNGTVPDDASRAAAEGAVLAMKDDNSTGIKGLVNNIMVTPPVTEYLSDGDLLTAANNALVEFPEITATVSHGVVTLNGKVESGRMEELNDVMRGIGARINTDHVTTR